METLVLGLLALAGLAFLYRVWTCTLSKITPSPRQTDQEPGAEPEPAPVTKEPDIPPDWFTSNRIFSLETRAIFSKTWIPLTTTTHFPAPGTYHTHNLAGIPIVLILGKDHALRAFHNVCRHRAYPVARRESGTATVLACRYHGWSYNSLGRLIRAPHFDGVEGFERGENGLFEVGVWVEGVDGVGVVWVNLGVGEVLDLDLGRLRGVGRRNGMGSGCDWVGGGTLEGVFNWKWALRTRLLEDALGLNEIPSRSFMQDILGSFHRKPESMYLFPNMFLFSIPRSRGWFSLSFLPTSERITSIRYDLCRSGNVQDEAALTNLEDKLRSVISRLETEYQSVNDPSCILADLDSKSLDIQKHILSFVKTHAKLEKSHGAQIHPAKREPRMNARYEQAEQRSCYLYLYTGS
ncbi:Rieske [2Fe-2S] iron-sulfur domain-containing protein [Aspergillus aurantiobrunneus]